MAVTYFTGAVDGDVTDDLNWTGVAPGAGDVGVFDRGSVDVDPSQGNIAAFGTLVIRPGYHGNIGATGNKMTSSIDTVMHQGTAELWLDDSAGTTADVFIRCASSNVVVVLGGDTMTRIHLFRGNVTLDGGLGVCAILKVGYVSSVLTDVKCNIVTSGNAVTLCHQTGGNVTLNKTMTTLHMSGGFLRVPINTSGVLTNTYQGGGRVENFGVGAMTDLHVSAGTFDLGLQAKTIARTVRGPAGTILNADPGVHTFTASLVDLANVT